MTQWSMMASLREVLLRASRLLSSLADRCVDPNERFCWEANNIMAQRGFVLSNANVGDGAIVIRYSHRDGVKYVTATFREIRLAMSLKALAKSRIDVAFA